MRSRRLLSSALVLATMFTPCFAKTHPRRGPTSPKRSTKRASTKPVAKHTGQRSIDDDRASQIQAALVRSGYMTEPSGHWDTATETAMQKYQSDNGWQTKIMPDSRAIIKLGLGPRNDTGSVASTMAAVQTSPQTSSDLNISQR
ncbi:putative peptidoglycan binding domain-containing protein [Edaphobacter albus]|uniref:putative peptidoglycan binding domain-containing protein n=1 Tax=Edaphobacter sp. 4G125 TaxID=2763071 RepID=UPI00351C5C24